MKPRHSEKGWKRRQREALAVARDSGIEKLCYGDEP
jgi:hypothetical protein